MKKQFLLILCALLLCMCASACAEQTFLYAEDSDFVLLYAGAEATQSIAVYYSGTPIVCLEEKDGFVKIEIGGGVNTGHIGYIKAGNTTTDSTVIPALPTAVVSESAQFGVCPLYSADLALTLGEYTVGTMLTVLGVTDKWYHVTVGGRFGFVSASDVSFDAPKELPVIENQTEKEEAFLEQMQQWEDERGLFYTWNFEQKAEYSQYCVLNQYEPYADVYYLIPDENALSWEEVITLANATVGEAFGLSGAEVGAYTVYVSYYVHAEDPDTPYWMVEYSEPKTLDGFSIVLDKTGTPTYDDVMGVGFPSEQATDWKNGNWARAAYDALIREKGKQVTWSVEDKARLVDGYGLPTAQDMTKEQAYEIAKQTIMARYNETEETLSRFTVCYGFCIADGWGYQTPYWQIDLICSDPLDIYEVFVLSPNGDVLLCMSGDEANG